MTSLIEKFRARWIDPKEKKCCSNCTHFDCNPGRSEDKGTCWIDGALVKDTEYCPQWKEHK